MILFIYLNLKTGKVWPKHNIWLIKAADDFTLLVFSFSFFAIWFQTWPVKIFLLKTNTREFLVTDIIHVGKWSENTADSGNSDKVVECIFRLTSGINLINKLFTFFFVSLSPTHISGFVLTQTDVRTHTRVHTQRSQLAGADKQSSLCLRAGMQASASSAELTSVCVCVCMPISVHMCASVRLCVRLRLSVHSAQKPIKKQSVCLRCRY